MSGFIRTSIGAILSALGLLAVIPPARADFFTQLDPAATYFHTNADGPDTAVPIDLAANGIHPGDLLMLRRVGFFDVGAGIGDTSHSLVGLFSSSSTLLSDTTLLDRVPGGRLCRMGRLS